MPQIRDPVVTFEVKVDGRPLSVERWVQLTHVIIDQRVRLPAMVSLGFHDHERKVFEDAGLRLGGSLRVAAAQGNSSTVLFDGEITALELDFDGSGMLAIVRGLDRSARLSRGTKTRTFLQKTYADIVRTIVGEYGMTADVDATQPKHEHVWQFNQSDLEFVHDMADEIGYDVWAEGNKLYFKKPKPAVEAPPIGNLQASNPLQLILGENVHSLRAVANAAGNPSSAEVRGWDPKEKRAVVSSENNIKPDGASNGVRPGDFAPQGTAVSVATPYRVKAETDPASKAFAQELTAPRIELEGLALGEPALRAGTTISLGQAGVKFDGRYTVTAARHVYEPGEGYRTEFSVTGRSDRTLHGLVKGAVRADGRGAHAGVEGVVPAIVTNTNDPENMGRVKVKFPWLTEAHESTWARPVQLIAGKGYGALIIPEINDEVLVAFEQGDPNRPYIVGSLYNGKDKPQKTSSDLLKSNKIAQRRIETPTLNRLVFFDHKGTKEGVTLRTGDDKFFLDLDKTNTKIVLSSNGDVTIEAKTGKVTITSQQDMVLKSSNNLTLEATNKTTIKGTQVEVAANASMKLQATGPLEAKGAVIKLN